MGKSTQTQKNPSAKLKAQNAKLQLKAKSETFLFSFEFYASALRFTLCALSLKMILHFELPALYNCGAICSGSF